MMEEDNTKAYELLAKIKMMIDGHNDNLKDESLVSFNDIRSDVEILDEIYDLITDMLPKKYLIAERLELDDRERKVLEELKKK